MPISRPDAERFWEKVNKTSDCWLWTGSVSPDGYGWFWSTQRAMYGRNGRMVRPHRWVYEQAQGLPLADGLEVDHLCRVRACVRPEHLEAVTRAVNNSRRGPFPNSLLTHCKRGHEFSPENTRLNGTRRVCITCDRAYHAAYRARHAA